MVEHLERRLPCRLNRLQGEREDICRLVYFFVLACQPFFDVGQPATPLLQSVRMARNSSVCPWARSKGKGHVAFLSCLHVNSIMSSPPTASKLDIFSVGHRQKEGGGRPSRRRDTLGAHGTASFFITRSTGLAAPHFACSIMSRGGSTTFR